MVLSLAVVFMSFECTGVYGKGVKSKDPQNSPGGNKKRSRPDPEFQSDGGFDSMQTEPCFPVVYEFTDPPGWRACRQMIGNGQRQFGPLRESWEAAVTDWVENESTSRKMFKSQ